MSQPSSCYRISTVFSWYTTVLSIIGQTRRQGPPSDRYPLSTATTRSGTLVAVLDPTGSWQHPANIIIVINGI